MRSKTASSKAAPKATPPAPAKSPRRGLAFALGLVTLIALGFAAWSWRQSNRPGAVHLQAGLDAQAAHQDAQAEQEWRAGTREDPAFPDDYAQLGDLYLGQQRFDEAVAQYQAAARLSPRDGTLFLRLTRAQLGGHHLVEALDAAKKAMDLRPDDADAAGIYGLQAARLADGPDALKALHRAVTLKPDDPDYRLALARQEINVVDLAGAERNLTALLQLAPTSGEGNRLMAVLLRQKPPTPENLARQLDLAQRAQAAMPSNPDVYLLLGQIKLAAGRPREALANFRHGYALRPESAEIANGLVAGYSRLGDTLHAAQAAAAVQQITARRRRLERARDRVRNSPSDTGTRLELARLEEENGEPTAAATEYAEAARRKPDDAQVLKALSGFRHRHGGI